MQSWCRTWPPNGSSHIRAKRKLLRKHKGACNSSGCRIGSLKSFTLTIPWNSAKLVKSLSWNHCTWTPHRSEINGVAERAVRRVKEGTSAVLLRLGLIEKLVNRFCGMLLPLAKYSGSFVGWEDTLSRAENHSTDQ